MAGYDAVIPALVEVVDGLFDGLYDALLGLVAPCAKLGIGLVVLHKVDETVDVEVVRHDTGTYLHGIVTVALLLDVYGHEYGRLTHV